MRDRGAASFSRDYFTSFYYRSKVVIHYQYKFCHLHKGGGVKKTGYRDFTPCIRFFQSVFQGDGQREDQVIFSGIPIWNQRPRCVDTARGLRLAEDRGAALMEAGGMAAPVRSAFRSSAGTPGRGAAGTLPHGNGYWPWERRSGPPSPYRSWDQSPPLPNQHTRSSYSTVKPFSTMPQLFPHEKGGSIAPACSQVTSTTT